MSLSKHLLEHEILGVGETTGIPGSGDVVGPSSATDTAVAVYSGTTGKSIKDSKIKVYEDESSNPVLRILGGIVDGEQTYVDIDSNGLIQWVNGGGQSIHLTPDLTGSFVITGPLAVNRTYATSGQTPDPSAIMDLQSTTLGFLLPRMTTAQMNSIESPAEGLTIYNLTEHEPQFWNGSIWKALGSAITATYRLLTESGNNLVTESGITLAKET